MSARIAAKDLTQGQELPAWSYKVVREDLVKYADASAEAPLATRDRRLGCTVSTSSKRGEPMITERLIFGVAWT